MTCKDCVHYEVCKEDVELHRDFYDCLEVDGVEKHCDFFKPKSRFVELPCEVGQTVWLTEFFVMGVWEKLETPISMTVEGFLIENGYIQIQLSWVELDVKWFGKTIFLTKEEAENALKERCEN